MDIGTPGTDSPSPRRRRTGLGTVWTGALLVTLAVTLRRIEESGAVPPEEFGPGALLFGSRPVLAVFAALLLGRGVIFGRIPDRRHRMALGGAAILVLVGLFVPEVLPAGILVLSLAAATLLLGLEDDPTGLDRRRDLGERLTRITLGRAVRALVIATLLGTAGVLALGYGETAFHTARFVPTLVTPEDLAGLRRGMLRLALILGLEMGLAIVVLVTLLAFALRGVRRLGVASHRLPLLATLALGQSIGAALIVLLRSCVGDEIDELGLSFAAITLGVLIGGFLSVPPFRRLERGELRAPGGRPITDGFSFAAALTFATLFPPLRLLGERLERRVLRSSVATVACLTVPAALGLLLLGGFLFPTVEDFRGQFFDFFAACAVLLVAAFLAAALSRFAPRGLAAGAAVVLVVAGLVASRAAADRPSVRLVAHEYSRIGSLALRFASSRWRPAERSALGSAPVQDVRFVHHAAGEDRLPGLPGEDRNPPILVFVWDAARTDHLSAYGYDRPTSTHLLGFRSRAARFTNAYSTATATTLSIRSLLSGRYATRYMLAQDHPPFLTYHLAEAGYDRFVVTVTGNDHNGVSAEAFRRNWPRPVEGIRFEDLDVPNVDDASTDPPKVHRTISALRRLLDERGDLRGTFTYVHLIGAHTPWENRDPVLDLGDGPVERYDGEIAKVDALFGRLVDALDEMGVLDEMILVVVADHGTGLGEHGRYGGFLPYQEQIRIPLLIRIPGVEPRDVGALVATIDVAPTILGLVTPDAPNPFHGRSLLPLLTGEREALPPRPHVSFCAFADAYALVDGDARYKLYHHRGLDYEALFDLEEDPAETRNLIEDRPGVAGRLRDLLGAFLWQGRDTYGNPYHYRDWTPPGDHQR